MLKKSIIFVVIIMVFAVSSVMINACGLTGGGLIGKTFKGSCFGKETEKYDLKKDSSLNCDYSKNSMEKLSKGSCSSKGNVNSSAVDTKKSDSSTDCKGVSKTKTKSDNKSNSSFSFSGKKNSISKDISDRNSKSKNVKNKKIPDMSKCNSYKISQEFIWNNNWAGIFKQDSKCLATFSFSLDSDSINKVNSASGCISKVEGNLKFEWNIDKKIITIYDLQTTSNYIEINLSKCEYNVDSNGFVTLYCNLNNSSNNSNEDNSNENNSNENNSNEDNSNEDNSDENNSDNDYDSSNDYDNDCDDSNDSNSDNNDDKNSYNNQVENNSNNQDAQNNSNSGNSGDSNGNDTVVKNECDVNNDEGAGKTSVNDTNSSDSSNDNSMVVKSSSNNSTSGKLPKTGEERTGLYVVIGIMLVSVGTIIYFKKRLA